MSERVAAWTRERRAALCSGADTWHTLDVPELGLPALRLSDGPNGVRGHVFDGEPSVCFPAAKCARGDVGHTARRGRGAGACRGVPTQGRRRAARADGQPPALPTRGAQLRDVLRGPIPHESPRGRLHRGPSAQWHRSVREALRRQRVRARAPHDVLRHRRANASRGVPAAVRGCGARCRRVGGDVRLQPPQRHPDVRSPLAPHARAPRRVGLHRHRHLRLGRDTVDGRGAASAVSISRCPGRRVGAVATPCRRSTPASSPMGS